MSGSYYALNSKYNSLLALINAGTAGYPPAVDVMTTNTAQTVTAVKTFSVLPESAVVPTTGDQLVNKTYADGLVGATQDIDQVLATGDTATGKQMLLNDAVGTNFTLYKPDEIQVSDGVATTAFFTPTTLDYNDGTLISATWEDIINTTNTPSIPTLDQVLTAGNDSNLNILLKDNLVTPTLTNTISSSSVSINGDGGSGSIGFVVGDVNVNGTATGVISGSVASATTLSLSNFTASSPPFFQPANTTATLSTTTASASLGFTSGGQFTNAKTMDLTLDGITHTSSTGGDFTINTTDNLLITSDNLNMSATALTIPAIGQPITAQITQDGLTMTDTTNSWNSWYRKSSAFVSNLAGTIYTYIQNTGIQLVDATTTTTLSPTGVTSGVSSATWATIIAGGAVNTLQQVLDAGSTATGANARVILNNSTTGGAGNPQLNLTNSSATAGNTNGVPYQMFYKAGRNVVVGDIVGTTEYFAKNYLGTITSFGKIESVITSSSAPTGDDGALDFYTCVNGVSSLVWRLNGADNENNSFRPIDMNGQDVKTSSGNMTISTASSTGTGNLNLNAKQHIQLVSGTTAGDIIGLTTNGNFTMTANTPAGGTAGLIGLTADRAVVLSSAQGGSDGNIVFDTNSIGDLLFVGTNLQSATSGGNSGQHLRIKLNGTFYKIRLEVD